MNLYAYRMIIWRGQDNVILRCSQLWQQFMIDMYAKVEGTTAISTTQWTEAAAEEYIHLWDAINCNANNAEIGNSIILPSSYVGSPRHMREYVQGVMTFLRESGYRVYLSRLLVI